MRIKNMSSSTSPPLTTTTTMHNNNNKEVAESVSSSTKSSKSLSSSSSSSSTSSILSALTTGPNDLADQKVSTSTPSIDAVTIAAAATAVTPLKSSEQITSIAESEEKSTLPASAPHFNPQNLLNSQSKSGSKSVKPATPNAPTSSINSSASNAQSPTDKTCGWCSESKSILKYVLPTPNGDKEFCTELCIAEFRKALKKGACSQCGNVVRVNVAPNREFCSTFCMNKVQTIATGRNAGDAVSSTTNFNGNSNKRNGSPLSSQPHLQRIYPIFDWDSYLMEKNSVAAPSSCFKQSREPPRNYFEPNMKLEALDPRCITSTCIGTVMRVVGARILIRLDGSDTQNDFWRLVDSTEIHDIGHCKRHGGMLQPPLSYTKSVNGWQTFLVRQLKNAVHAPKHAFQSEPPAPKSNMFKVGYKLEAVDKKNPHMICVATVGAVKDDQILVTFDGWRSSSDFWTRFDSRDIFPIKWCERSGYPLDPPGERNKLDSNANKRRSAKSLPISGAIDAGAPHITIHFHTKCRGGRFINSSRLPTKVTATTYKSLALLCMQEILSASPDATQLSALLCNVNGDRANIVTHVNKNYPIKIPSCNNMSELGFAQFLQIVCTTCKACPNLITLEAGPDQCDKCAKHEQKKIEEQERYEQAEKQRLQQQKERQQRQELERKRQKEQQQQQRQQQQQSKMAQGERRQTHKRPIDFDGESSSSQSSSSSSSGSSSKISRKSIEHTSAKASHTPSASVTTTSISFTNTRTTTPTVSRPEKQQQQQPQKQQQQQQQQQPSPAVAASSGRPADRTRVPTGPVNEWSIEEVIQYITITDPSLAIHSDLLRKHEIDGIAFLLLNSDMMMKYMNLKLGPALKICNLVSRAKGRPHV